MCLSLAVNNIFKMSVAIPIWVFVLKVWGRAGPLDWFMFTNYLQNPSLQHICIHFYVPVLAKSVLSVHNRFELYTTQLLSLPAGLPQSCKLPVLNLLTGQKSAFSPCRGNSLHWFTWNLAQLRSTWVRLARQNTPISPRGECGPQNGKKIIFLVKSRPTGANPLTDFYSCLGLL